MDSTEGHTPTPWRACGENRGGCSCLQIWSTFADCPVATVTGGEWGDEYPQVRFVGEEPEAYMEKITYGVIPMEFAKANAALIVRAVNSHKALVEALTKDVERLVRIREKLLSWSDMTGTQRAYFANWVWHAENETRDALRLAGEDQS